MTPGSPWETAELSFAAFQRAREPAAGERPRSMHAVFAASVLILVRVQIAHGGRGGAVENRGCWTLSKQFGFTCRRPQRLRAHGRVRQSRLTDPSSEVQLQDGGHARDREVPVTSAAGPR